MFCNNSQYLIVCHFAVLQVVSPYSAEDAKGLIKAAVRDNDPGTSHEILLLQCCLQ